jgi:hypothetical protein
MGTLKIREQRAEGKEQKAKSREHKAKNGRQSAQSEEEGGDMVRKVGFRQYTLVPMLWRGNAVCDALRRLL